jgi:DNA-binding transcriptional LysR family regulator
MTPDQLLTFAMVAQHRNISRAAQLLHLSQPAVSGQLRLLQESIGEPLYHREGRGIELTPTGQQLAQYAQRAQSAYAEAQAFRRALKGIEAGTLRLGASTTPASYVLPYLVAEFHTRHPGIHIEMLDGNTGEIMREIAELDIAFIEGTVPANLSPEIHVYPWHRDNIVAIVPSSHPLAQGDHTVDLDTLASYPLIWREPGSGVRQVVEDAFAARGLETRIALELAGVEGVKEAVRAGMGIGFVSAMSMRHGDDILTSLNIRPTALLSRRFSILVPNAASGGSHASRAFLALSQSGLPLTVASRI